MLDRIVQPLGEKQFLHHRSKCSYLIKVTSNKIFFFFDLINQNTLLVAQHFSIRYSYLKILTMDNLVQRIDLEIERRSLLKHKFYRLWSEGKLDLVDLKGYSSEYFQLVKAVPLMVDNVLSYCTKDMPLRSAIQENRREEI